MPFAIQHGHVDVKEAKEAVGDVLSTGSLPPRSPHHPRCNTNGFRMSIADEHIHRYIYYLAQNRQNANLAGLLPSFTNYIAPPKDVFVTDEVPPTVVKYNV